MKKMLVAIVVLGALVSNGANSTKVYALNKTEKTIKFEAEAKVSKGVKFRVWPKLPKNKLHDQFLPKLILSPLIISATTLGTGLAGTISQIIRGVQILGNKLTLKKDEMKTFHTTNNIVLVKVKFKGANDVEQLVTIVPPRAKFGINKTLGFVVSERNGKVVIEYFPEVSSSDKDNIIKKIRDGERSPDGVEYMSEALGDPDSEGSVDGD